MTSIIDCQLDARWKIEKPFSSHRPQSHPIALLREAGFIQYCIIVVFEDEFAQADCPHNHYCDAFGIR